MTYRFPEKLSVIMVFLFFIFDESFHFRNGRIFAYLNWLFENMNLHSELLKLVRWPIDKTTNWIEDFLKLWNVLNSLGRYFWTLGILLSLLNSKNCYIEFSCQHFLWYRWIPEIILWILKKFMTNCRIKGVFSCILFLNWII